jgi:hypothetical protein
MTTQILSTPGGLIDTASLTISHGHRADTNPALQADILL